MSNATCSQRGCIRKGHFGGLCAEHCEEQRAGQGEICRWPGGCARGRLSSRFCNKHQTMQSRAERGRHDSTYTVTCDHCGETAEVKKSSARFCSHECWDRERKARTRSKLLPILHPDPLLITALPAKHPARRVLPGDERWWKMIVAGPCAWCSEHFVAVASTYETRSLYCSKRCQRKVFRARRGRFLVPPSVRLEIYERDGWKCQLCGKRVGKSYPLLHDRAPSLDHVVPRSLGGSDEPTNLQLAHRICNSRKLVNVWGVGEQLRIVG